MRELPTLLLFFAFLSMCGLMLFLKNSKTYDHGAKMPLDEDIKEKLDTKNSDEELS